LNAFECRLNIDSIVQQEKTEGNHIDMPNRAPPCVNEFTRHEATRIETQRRNQARVNADRCAERSSPRIDEERSHAVSTANASDPDANANCRGTWLRSIRPRSSREATAITIKIEITP
jgi:hypothetical protein